MRHCSPNTDWSSNLRQIGADDRLIDAIARSGLRHDGIRLTKSAAEWVDLAIEWRWEWLLYVKGASDKRALGGMPLALDQRDPIQVQTQIDHEDVVGAKYDRKDASAVDAKGKSLEYIPLWRGTSRVKAEQTWALPMRTGKFNIKSQLCRSPTDFSATRDAQYWTPDIEGAQMYASFARKIAEPAEVCLVRIEVPQALLKKQTILHLRYPDEKWKMVVWHSRRREKMPKDLQKLLNKQSLLIGDIATGMDEQYHKLATWDGVDERCLLKLSNGTPMTQYVFGLHDDEDDDIDLAAYLKKQSGRTSIRKADNPNVKLPCL